MTTEARGNRMRDERVLHIINRYVSLKFEDTKRNNEILLWVIEDIVGVLKSRHEFFRDHFQEIVFVGSYYKGTKVGKPEEFDLNLIIRLPVNYETIRFERDFPGFTKLKLNEKSYLPKWDQHKKLLSKWVSSEGYLNQDKFRQWMESLFQDMPGCIRTRNGNYKIKVGKSGPAFTLYVEGPGLYPSTMCVDLVPVLEFKNILTPLQMEFGLRDDSWYAVPKPFRPDQETPPLNWRPSFYSFESNVLKRVGKFKPTIRYVKKLRDKEDWKLIASYHIETLFMHEILAINNDPAILKLSGIELFIHMLQRLKEACEEIKILNFWDRNHNLIGHLKHFQLANIIGRLKKIIKDIEADPLAIAKFLLCREELCEVAEELDDIRSGRNLGNIQQPMIRSVQPTESPESTSFFWKIIRAIFTIVSSLLLVSAVALL